MPASAVDSHRAAAAAAGDVLPKVIHLSAEASDKTEQAPNEVRECKSHFSAADLTDMANQQLPGHDRLKLIKIILLLSTSFDAVKMGL